MKSVRPKPLGAPTDVELTPEEDFVLARIDGRLSVSDLVALTGLEETRVQQIVSNLASRGAVALDEASSGYLPDVASRPDLGALSEEPEKATLADFAAALGMDPSTFAAARPAAAVEEPVPDERVESRSNYPPPATTAEEEPIPELTDEHVVGDEEPMVLGEEHIVTEEAPESSETEAQKNEEEFAANERNYRQLYMSKFHVLTADARVAAAKTAHGPDLFALCFDAEPRVIAAILENANCGLDHARLIAFHHRTGTGLEVVSRRADWIKDLLVERRLLRNPMCGDTVLSRIMSSKRVFPTYRIAIDRDVPEITRAKSRGHLRQKWQKSATPEERSDLILRTEARCLIIMTGCTFDARTTQILCGKQYNSTLFIQNLAKFPATPPALLAHLVKQPFVRKIPPLKKLLLQHPNMPGEVKRQL